MRLDKFLTELNIGSRSQVKDFLRQGYVTVNGETVCQPDLQIRAESDRVTFQGRDLQYRRFEYYMLNKPKGCLSAARDPKAPTVLEFLPPGHKKDIFPVGRLDKDTEGLLLLTNDGDLAHRLLSPKKHVSKTYLAKIKRRLTDEEIARLEQGVELGEDGVTGPAFVTVLSDFPEEGDWIHLTISEGKFHQVKRMLEAVDNQVLYLKRIRFGALNLDPLLPAGQVRELTDAELKLLNRSAEIRQNKRELIAGKKAVIFDLDGSLVDSMWLWADIDREYLGKFGIPLPDHKKLQRRIEGMSFHQTAVYFKENYEIPDDIETMKDTWNRMAWDKYANEVLLKSGIPDFLQGCRRSNIRLGIATSNSRELVKNILRVHDLESFFSCIKTGSEVINGKPAPDIYLAVSDEMGIAPKDCLVFEDILPGLRAGRAAGMTVCAVEDAYSADTREEKRAFADYYIEDYYDFF